ncbi:hypothetical protein EHO60_13625 [Leptospira fletcheri]|uniref:Uncharacterized protein n=1 Tax=Leptospira fletcheri TaxID=2484981 RepID=A0A4R9GBJ8_9LEPT|nr:hypothetical protein [Leptospira fletcheri]TGK09053.1 hypothetical protein EHO60_13625 [Leptospira fletcheri]
MQSEGPQKSGFPFHPLEDSVLGEVFARTLELSGISRAEANAAILSHLKQAGEFQFTPNSKKQVLLQSMPSMFRELLEQEKDSEILETFRKEIQEEGRLDLALELLEWIFTGYEKEALVVALFELLLNGKVRLPEGFYGKMMEEYEREMRGDLDRLRE